MKKLHIALLVASFIVPSTSFASIDANLKYGSRGLEVTELQDFLIEKGFLTGQASGNFFSLTRKAVVAYQSSVGLPATGYVGPMTRTKINNDLSTANAPAVSAEITETGTTTAPTNTLNTATLAQTNTTASSFISGCSSTLGFSTTTGKHCSDTATTATLTANKTVTLSTGAVVEIDALGNIVRTVTSAPVVPSTPSNILATVTSTESALTLSISLGDTTATINSAHIAWSTSMPTDSKVFFTPPSGATQVVPSVSGYSTQHFVNIQNLTPNTQYSYTIEAINGTQDKKLSGVVSTNALPPTNIVVAPSGISGCPNSPTITLTPETDNAMNAIYKVTAQIQGDIITYHIAYNDPKYGIYPAQGDSAFPVYLGVRLADPCFLISKLEFSYDTTSQHAWASPHLWNAGGDSEGFVVSPVATTTPQIVTVTASEPNGGTTTKTVTVIAQY